MNNLLSNIFDNPILVRELRRRMRGKALIYSIISYLVLMTLSTVLVLLVYSPGPFAQADMKMLQRLQETGENIFYWITGIQILLVLIIAPTITAGLTTGEKEKKTFDFLRVTTITRWMYIMGCFLSTSFYVGLALICALPLLSLTFLYGGVGLPDVVSAFFYLLGGSFVLSAFGLYISSVTERTRTAQGIIVFLIFASIFGGFILYQQYRMFFAGAAAAAAAGTAGGVAPGTIFLFNVAVPSWILGVAGMVALSGVFLLLAARKLFEPEETRAFSHLQFALLFAAILLGGLGMLSGNTFLTETPELFFMTVGYVVLLVAVQSFAVGRMEVGDEIWHLKRLFPMLRPIDQTIPFLALLGLGWYLAMSAFPKVVLAQISPLALPSSFLQVSLASFAFFVFLARAAMGHTGSRRKAFRFTFGSIVAVTLVLPTLIAVMANLLPGAAGFWRELAVFSPFAMLIDAFRNPTVYAAGSIGRTAVLVYVVLAAVIGVWGEWKRYVRWRDYDYHYDMPVG